ncbi:MAG: Lactoylglutathione lyase [Hyphomicrobiales bacterium]|nr:Lactoylglutathione lyase [Hyphomicrobiales bacterium]
MGKLGFQAHTDARNGSYRWLTVKHPNQPSFELGLFLPQEPVLDAATVRTMREMVAKGAMPPLTLVVDDCRAAYDKLRANGVEFNQEPLGVALIVSRTGWARSGAGCQLRRSPRPS